MGAFLTTVRAGKGAAARTTKHRGVNGKQVPHLLEPLRSDNGRISLADVGKSLSRSPKTIKERIRIGGDGTFTVTLMRGEAFPLRVLRKGDSDRAPIEFDRNELSALQLALTKQDKELRTVKQMAAELAELGMPIGEIGIITRFRKGTMNDHGQRVFIIDGEEHPIGLEISKGDRKTHNPLCYLSIEKFELFKRWLRNNYDADDLAKFGHGKKNGIPDGHVWFGDAAQNLGIQVTTLRARVRAGELATVRTDGNLLAIPVSEVERLRREVESKTVPEGSVELNASLEKLGIFSDRRIVKRDEQHFFVFENERGGKVEFKLYTDFRTRKYWISNEDLAKIKGIEDRFKRCYAPLSFVEQNTHWALGTLIQKIGTGRYLCLELPGGEIYRIQVVKRYGQLYVSRSAVLAYTSKSRKVGSELLTKKDVARELGLSLSGLEGYIGAKGIDFSMNGQAYSIRWKTSRRKRVLTKAEVDAIKKYREITVGRKGTYGTLSRAVLTRGGIKRLDIQGREIVLHESPSIRIPLEEVDGNFYINARYRKLLYFYLDITSAYGYKRLKAFRELLHNLFKGDPFELEMLLLLKSRRRYETHRVLKPEMERFFGQPVIRKLLSAPATPQKPAQLSLDLTQVDFFGDFERLVSEGIEDGEITLCDYYGIAIPVNGKEIDYTHLELLLFANKLFFNSPKAALREAKTFLSDVSLIGSDDISLAKVWLVRFYYISTTFSKFNEKRLSVLLEQERISSLFKTDPSSDSKIFRKGKPFLSEDEFLAFVESVRGNTEFQELVGFIYPSSY